MTKIKIPKTSKKIISLIAAIIVLVYASLTKTNNNKSSIISPTPTPTINAISHNQERTKVIRVIDGDTIEIEGKRKVRYIGIDAPETKDPKRPEGCFGKEASEKNKELVEGKEIYIEKDISETDRYGRLLRYVWLVNENSQKREFINDHLVREGYAHASTFPPDVKYSSLFLEAQSEARANNRGLWESCPFSKDVQH